MQYVMKNCDPLVSGPLLAMLTCDTTHRRFRDLGIKHYNNAVIKGIKKSVAMTSRVWLLIVSLIMLHLSYTSFDVKLLKNGTRITNFG